MKELVQISKSHKRESLVVICIVACALLVRIVLVIGLESYRIPDNKDHWAFGYETGRVASAITNGNGFSSPFAPGGSLPTAWLAPVYPYFLALIFKIFGTYSQGAAFAALFMNSLFSSLTCAFVYYTGKAAMNKNTGLASSVIFALYPPSIWHSINTIWNTTLSGLAIAYLVFYALKCYQDINSWKSVTCGVLMGITALTNPVIMAFYPFYFFWLYSGLRTTEKKIYVYLAQMILALLLVMSPWLIRNYLVFGQFIFVKSTLGVELRLGNNPDATGSLSMTNDTALHPSFSEKEMNLYNELNEVKYAEYCLEKALGYVFKNPSEVMLLVGKRVALFWLGDLVEENNWTGNVRHVSNLSLLKKFFYILPLPFFIAGIVLAWKNKLNISIFIYLLLSYPLIYYATHVANRYRHPVEAFILILATYSITDLYSRFRKE